MPVFEITAVDHTTDTFEIVAHGLLTGAGPAGLRNIGGALPAAAPALDEDDTYYIIVVDGDHVKLAATSADALANTPIALSGNGTGTTTLELGIPYQRARTYVPKEVSVAGAQVKSADMNALQDGEKALYRGAHAAQWRWQAPLPTVVVAGTHDTDAPGQIESTSNGAEVSIPINLGQFAGQKVLGIGVHYIGSGVVDSEIAVYLQRRSTTLSALVDVGTPITVDDSGDTDTHLAKASFTAEDIVDGPYFARVTFAKTGSILAAVGFALAKE